MGSQIAEVLARHGADVLVIEGSEDLADAGRSRINASLDRAMNRGRLEEAERETISSRIDVSIQLSDLADADLVIEAATEDPEAKRAIFARLGEIAGPDAPLASNTSSIPIMDLALASGQPERVIGMHFFNPPTTMELVEIIPAETTGAEIIDLVEAYATETLGKRCVRVRDEAGFIVNRLLIPFVNDAIELLDDEVATRDDIDAAAKLGLAHPMGPLALADLIGLDTVMAIGEILAAAHGDERSEPPDLLREMVEEGRLGRKTGRGFYDYD
jgi:3-hydroxybutyryl-CoA dehydrogenase